MIKIVRIIVALFFITQSRSYENLNNVAYLENSTVYAPYVAHHLHKKLS